MGGPGGLAEAPARTSTPIVTANGRLVAGRWQILKARIPQEQWFGSEVWPAARLAKGRANVHWEKEVQMERETPARICTFLLSAPSHVK